MIIVLENAKLDRKNGSRKAKEGPKEAKNATQRLWRPTGRAPGVYSKCCAHAAAHEVGANHARLPAWENFGKTTKIDRMDPKMRFPAA